jgi:hypothetical protein
MTLITNTKYNFDKAENAIFSWSYYDGTNGGTLRHKASGREIYQMYWCTNGKMAEPVEGEARQQASAFWSELRALQKQKPPKVEVADTEPAHGQNGYCRKCHSYCYGDCQAH